MMRIVLAILLVVLPAAAPAAVCTWNVASGDWSQPSNWDGCADGGGPSTRSPGPGDVAVLVGGTANLDVSPSVAEFELGAGGVLPVVGGTKTFDVAVALRLNGGHTTTILGSNQLLLRLAAGGTGSLLASTSFDGATFFQNSGTTALGSATGTALTLLGASQVQNMDGGHITMSGGDSRLYLSLSSQLINNEGATLTISGNALIGRPDSQSGLTYVINEGTILVTGPGTLAMPMGTGIFQQFGELTVSNATLVCDSFGAEICRFIDSNGSGPTGAVTRLDNATLQLGGAAYAYPISQGSTMAGTGTVDSSVQVRGTLAPGADGGAPYGTLAFTGDLLMQATGTLALDLGSATSYDRVQVGGQASAGFDTAFDGYGRLALHLAGGYAPALGDALPVMTYASVQAGAAFHRVDANYTLDYVARFDPTALEIFPGPRVTIADQSVIEGASGMSPMTFEAHLSQPFSQTVTIDLRPRDGTAVYGLSPDGDYLLPGDNVLTFAPGQTVATQVYQINGDTVVEGDESFAVELLRNRLVNASIGNGVPGDLFAIGTIETDELPPDTRFVLVGKDNGTSGHKIRRYTTAGLFIDAWDDRMPNALGDIVTGMCFAPDGDVLATRFAYPSAILFSHVGARINDEFGDPAPLSTHESCVFDRDGTVYIGIAGGGGAPDEDVPVRKFSRYGELLDEYVLPTGTRGTDWIDLGADRCTLYYTSEDTAVRRYDLCTRTALPDLIDDLTPPYCYAMRVRPNREVMVACQEAVHRIGPDGTNLHTYTRQSIGETDPAGLFAMNLDPDGTSFWTAGALSGNVYHVDIESGTVLASFNSGSGGVAGLAVYGDLQGEVLFADGFDPVQGAPRSAGKRAPQPECPREFRPEIRDMPHYVPRWMSVVARDDGECEP